MYGIAVLHYANSSGNVTTFVQGYTLTGFTSAVNATAAAVAIANNLKSIGSADGSVFTKTTAFTM